MMKTLVPMNSQVSHVIIYSAPFWDSKGKNGFKFITTLLVVKTVRKEKREKKIN